MDDKRKNALKSKIKTNDDLIAFSEEQISAFNSNITDSLDDALAILERENKKVNVKKRVAWATLFLSIVIKKTNIYTKSFF